MNINRNPRRSATPTQFFENLFCFAEFQKIAGFI